ncbi:efflux RND transporter periplasmic adaptor subunit [Novosphingobium sp. 9]|uniref:efflux RND transporter periplasmic adaptor subunit n=1 Tax=Novosphingobium sp. 9 TaxID=2025349 RepID=UPI00391F4BBC
MKTTRRAQALRGALIATVALSLAACGSSDKTKKGGAPEVGYIVAQPSDVPLPVILGGRTVSFESSDVRPQVTGLIKKRLFTEGDAVRAGQPLFVIDQSLYTAAVNQAKANLASARATAAAARAKSDRYKPLAAMQAIAQQDYTDALAATRVADATVAQMQAALDTAQVNLRFTTVPAPISGRIGRSLYTVGALVSSAQTDPLAQIERTDPMYVDMKQSSTDLLALRQKLSSGGVDPGSTVVHLHMQDGSTYPVAGTVKFSEVIVDEATGTVTLRAQFPNPTGFLMPGMFVNAEFDQSIEKGAYLVPQAAVQRDFDGSAFVMVVGADGKAARRKVDSDRTAGVNAVVTSGLKAGDKIIVQGLNGLKQGAAIKPVPASTPQKVQDKKAGADKGAASGTGKQG